MIRRVLGAWMVLAALALLPALAGGTGLSCKDGVAPWKGKPVGDLLKAWGPPTSEKALSGGGKKLVYDLVPDAPREKKPRTTPLPQSVADPRGREEVTASTTYEKGKDGWKAKPEDKLPPGPSVVGYEFEVGKDGTIVKVRCKD